jgi:hypothetical protein
MAIVNPTGAFDASSYRDRQQPVYEDYVKSKRYIPKLEEL